MYMMETKRSFSETNKRKEEQEEEQETAKES
jgi:hypothetical protein